MSFLDFHAIFKKQSKIAKWLHGFMCYIVTEVSHGLYLFMNILIKTKMSEIHMTNSTFTKNICGTIYDLKDSVDFNVETIFFCSDWNAVLHMNDIHLALQNIGGVHLNQLNILVFPKASVW